MNDRDSSSIVIDFDAHGDVQAYDPDEEIRPQRSSFIRMRLDLPSEPYGTFDGEYAEPPTVNLSSSGRAPASRDVLANDQLNLTVNVLHLRRLVDSEAVHPFAQAVAHLVANRLGDLDDIREAVDTLLALDDARLQALLAPGKPLTVYMKGVFLFCERLVEAFEDLLGAAAHFQVDWMGLRKRVAEGMQFFFDGLADAVRFELAQTAATENDELEDVLDELFFAGAYLNERAVAFTQSGPVIPTL